MKRILLFLLLFALACTPQTIESELSSFLATRSDEPLKNTIWEHQTGEQYNRYLWFSEADVSLFYGLVEAGELQRWSDFYTAPYRFEDGKRIFTHLHYPLYESDICTQEAYYIEGNGMTVIFDGDTYTYYGPYTEDIEGQWISITVTIAPWEKPKE